MASTLMPRVRSTAERRPDLIEAAATLVAAFWLAWPFWRPGRYVVGFDTAAYSGPNLRFTFDEWGAGRLPLWNDRIFGGVAHLGNTQAGVLYPFRLLVAPFDVNRGLNLLIAMHIVLFVMGLYWLARRLRLRPPAGFVTAVAGGASGAALVKTIQFEQYLVLAWAPIVLIAVHAVITGARPWRAAGGLAAAASCTVLAGHPQITYLTGCLAAAWTLALLLGTRAWRRLLPLVAAGGLALATCALQLLATAAATGVSAVHRTRELRDLALPDRAVAPNQLLQVLLGTVRDIGPDRFAGSFESIGYVGVAGALLAGIGLVAGWRAPARRHLAAVLAVTALVAAVLALGSRTVFYRGAYRLVPGFDLPRVPARWLDVTVICVAILAGIGTDAIARRAVGRPELIAVAALGAMVFLTAGTGLADVAFGRRTVAGWLVVAAAVGAAVFVAVRRPRRLAQVPGPLLVAAVLAIELGIGWTRGATIRPTFSESFDTYTSPTAEFLAGEEGWEIAYTDDGFEDPAQLITGMRPNGNVLMDVSSLDGYDGGVQVTERWLTLAERDADGPNAELPLRNQLALPLDTEEMARMYVRWVLIDNTRDAAGHVPGWLGPIVTDERASVYENPAWRNEATMWFQTTTEASPTAAARLLRARIGELSNTAIVPYDLQLRECTGDCTPRPLDLERVSPRELRVETDATTATFISVASQYDDGWRVTIDDAPHSATTLDGVFLGVAVPAGEHTVVFTYDPSWKTPGVVLSLLGAAGIVALAVGERRYHRRHAGRDAVHHG